MTKESDLEFCPALRFEVQFNRKYKSSLQVSEDYNLPEGFDSFESLNKYLGSIYTDGHGKERPKEDVFGDFKLMASGMVKANPKLEGLYKKIDQDNFAEVANFTLGVASRFNQDDIEYYTKHHFADLLNGKHTANAYKGVAQRFSRKIDIPINWVPSPETLKKISTAYEASVQKLENKNIFLKDDLINNFSSSINYQNYINNFDNINRFESYALKINDNKINDLQNFR